MMDSRTVKGILLVAAIAGAGYILYRLYAAQRSADLSNPFVQQTVSIPVDPRTFAKDIAKANKNAVNLV